MKRIALPHIAVSVVVDPLFFYLLFAISPFSIFFFFFFRFHLPATIICLILPCRLARQIQNVIFLSVCKERNDSRVEPACCSYILTHI
jgi:hypothetical protein